MTSPTFLFPISSKKLYSFYLVKVYGDKVSDEEAENMMIMISGVFICHYSDVFTGKINDYILTIGHFFSSDEE